MVPASVDCMGILTYECGEVEKGKKRTKLISSIFSITKRQGERIKAAEDVKAKMRYTNHFPFPTNWNM